MTRTIKKRMAFFPDVREELCNHIHMAWAGSMPCTGKYMCFMCGYTQEEINQIEKED